MSCDSHMTYSLAFYLPTVEKRLEAYVISTVVPSLQGMIASYQKLEGQSDTSSKTSTTNPAPTGEVTGEGEDSSKGKSPPAAGPSKGKSPPAAGPSNGKSPPANGSSKGKSPPATGSSKGKSGVPHPDELGAAKGKLKPTQVSWRVPVR